MPKRSINLFDIALLAEHDGWHLVFEPIIFALILVFSWYGSLFATALFIGFLTY